MKLSVVHAKLNVQRNHATVYLRNYGRIGSEVILESVIQNPASFSRSEPPSDVELFENYWVSYIANYLVLVHAVTLLRGAVVYFKTASKAVASINLIKLRAKGVKEHY